MGVPFVILYRVHPLTFAIGKRLIRIHSIGLANVVAGRRIVPEFLQDLDPAAIGAEALDRSPSSAASNAGRPSARGLAAGLRGLGRPGVAGRVARELQKMALRGRVHAKG